MSLFLPPPPGLPGHLPPGERMLWQGRPEWRAFAKQVFHVRVVAGYVALVVAWCVASLVMDGRPAADVAVSSLRYAAVAVAPVLFLLGYAWLIVRSTTYTVTNRRVAFRIGSIVPMTINVPYARIESAAVSTRPDGSGDISLLLIGKDRLAYLLLWPHARPWRLARAEPTLRAIPDVAAAAQIIARALAASANMPAPTVLDTPVQPGTDAVTA